LADEDQTRAERVGINEALFREVNERMRELNEGFAAFTGTWEIVCECAELTCVERLVVAPADYERVRLRVELFIVAPAHVVAGEERVLEEHGGYTVVEKLGEAAETAKETEPRT
jgi:hypothetical protein